MGGLEHIAFILIIVLLVCAVIGLLWWGFTQLWPLIPLPEPIKRVVYVILVVVIGIMLLFFAYNLLMGGAGSLGCFGSRC